MVNGTKKGERGTYRLAEFEGTMFQGYFLWKRMKWFIVQE